MNTNNVYENSPNQKIKLHEGWLEHKHSGEKQWRKYWCVLVNDVIFIFSSKETKRSTHIGNLTITPGSKLDIRPGLNRDGYRFDLHTSGRVNVFKTSKHSDREVWKAYIEGISFGEISNEIDLPGQQLAKMRLDLQLPHTIDNRSSPPSRPIPATPQSTHNEGFDTPESSTSSQLYRFNSLEDYTEPQHGASPADHIGWNTRLLDDTLSGGASSENVKLSARRQGPKFYLDSSQVETPSWFFFDCPREKAENILRQVGIIGNTLMRENSDKPGQYAISKRMEEQQGICHYRLTHSAAGYKVEVDNVHEPMACLMQVMQFFVSCSGATTKLVSANDRKLVKSVHWKDLYTSTIEHTQVSKAQDSRTWSPHTKKSSGFLDGINQTRQKTPVQDVLFLEQKKPAPGRLINLADSNKKNPSSQQAGPSILKTPTVSPTSAPILSLSRPRSVTIDEDFPSPPSSPPPPPPQLPASNPPSLPTTNTTQKLEKQQSFSTSQNESEIIRQWQKMKLRSKSEGNVLKAVSNTEVKNPPLPPNHPPPLSKDDNSIVKDNDSDSSGPTVFSPKSAEFRKKLEMMFSAVSKPLNSQNPVAKVNLATQPQPQPDTQTEADYETYESLDNYVNSDPSKRF